MDDFLVISHPLASVTSLTNSYRVPGSTHRRDIRKIARSHDTALIAIPELHEPLCDEKDIVGFVMVVEARRIG